MGALIFEPAQGGLEQADLDLLTLATNVRDVVDDLAETALNQLVLVGGSPQGARPKALVRYDPDSKHVSTLETAPGTDWLVKFPAHGEHAEVCALEYVYAEMARMSGLNMPRTQYFPLAKGLSAFAIERFDRVSNFRVPMHTLAGALHANYQIPSVDYQTMLRMTRFMTRSEGEVLKAFERCVFNVVFIDILPALKDGDSSCEGCYYANDPFIFKSITWGCSFFGAKSHVSGVCTSCIGRSTSRPASRLPVTATR